jgi:preprotein translocase subunit SecA
MAGRGTDIVPGPGVAARGGLHVLCCQDNPSARLDRQVIGRAGRQGEPGTVEVWRALDAPAWQPGSDWTAALDRWLQAGRLASPWFAWRQSRHEGLQFRLRRAEIDQDLHWQHRTGRSPNHED